MTFSAFCARCRKKVKKAERIIRYFDMFAGVGGFRAGLDLAGRFQCIGHCEIDKYADASYRAIHAPGKEEVYYFALFALHFGVYTEFGTDPSFLPTPQLVLSLTL